MNENKARLMRFQVETLKIPIKIVARSHGVTEGTVRKVMRSAVSVKVQQNEAPVRKSLFDIDAPQLVA